MSVNLSGAKFPPGNETKVHARDREVSQGKVATRSIILSGAVAIVLAVSAAPAHAPNHPAKAHAVHHTKAANKALICPVTGTKIASVKAAVGHSTFKGKTYYFCCPGCKPRFDKNPQKFVTDSAHGMYEKM